MLNVLYMNVPWLADAWCQNQSTISLYANSLVPRPLLELASFPGPAQLFVAYSTEKRERAGIIYHMRDVGVERT